MLGICDVLAPPTCDGEVMGPEMLVDDGETCVVDERESSICDGDVIGPTVGECPLGVAPDAGTIAVVGVSG